MTRSGKPRPLPEHRRSNDAPAPAAGSERGIRLALVWVVLSAPLVFLLLQLPAGGWWALFVYQATCVVAARAGGVAWGTAPRWPEGAAWVVSTLALMLLLPAAVPDAGHLLAAAMPALQAWGMHGIAGAGVLIWYVLANPWIEEAFWRGTLLGPRGVAVLGRRGSALVASVGFVPFHLVVLAQLLGSGVLWSGWWILAASVAWTCMTRWRRSLVPAALSHQAADVVLVLLALR